jgi:hypothetical protein
MMDIRSSLTVPSCRPYSRPIAFSALGKFPVEHLAIAQNPLFQTRVKFGNFIAYEPDPMDSRQDSATPPT